MLHYRTASGLVASTARGRYRNASGQSVAFGPDPSGGNETFHFFQDSDVLSSTADSFSDTELTVGTRFYSSQNLYNLGLRFLAPFAPPPSNVLRACLFNDGAPGSLIKNVTFTLPQLSTKEGSTWTSLYWHEVLWDEPVLIPALETWTVAVVTNRYVARSSFHDAPITRGSLSAPVSAGRYSGEANPPNHPLAQFNSSTYYIDGIYSLTI